MNHKKHPVFIRVVTNNKHVVCINPLQLSSFQILEKAKVKVKADTAEGFTYIEADTLRFYYPTGTGLTYSVGVDITQEEFNYICHTLQEFLYLNEVEFRAKGEASERKKLELWNQIAEEEVAPTLPKTKDEAQTEA
jgi:hypothetical protein